jgi:hypothetical protein
MHDLSSGKLKSDIHFFLFFVSLLFCNCVHIVVAIICFSLLQSGIARSFFAISFLLHQCFYYFFRNFFADVIRRQLEARISDKPLLHPPVLFPGLEDDSSYTQRGPLGDVAGDNVEFGHLRVCFFNHTFFFFCFFANVTTVFLLQLWFLLLSFLLIFAFSPVAFFNLLAAENYYGHVLWSPCGVFDSTTPPQIRTCPRCRC